ncbi:MAG: cell envelope integrity protein TolA [Sulfuriferula multivorans]|uniref:Cell envelope integrity protein TolA n=1 Tax=Sulfuriferula multivorans TaxID=1559896 RepID=A0A7C9KYM7_9PROT|nr:cell envelope integrity protein TolA [Sulfuriferula multivorans]
MNLPEDAPFVSRPGSNLAAGAMALGVHVLFLLLLVFGVSWQTQHPAPVMVDIWDAVPPLPSPKPRPQPKTDPPAPVKLPVPVKAEPVPVVKEVPPPKAPDIALEQKKADAERVKKLKALHEAEQKARDEAAHTEAEAIKKKRELLRKMDEEALLQRISDEDAANETRRLKQAEAKAAASKRQSELDKAVGQFRDKISATVRGNTRLPDNLKGNPEVRCSVRLLPTGEVLSIKVTQSSGNVAYDEAVVRAIEKSSPLPLPAERDARAEFVPELSFVHRPKD